MIDSNFIGRIKVKEIKDNANGTATVIFDVDRKFKNEFKKMFNLKRWSTKFFNSMLDEAIKNMYEGLNEPKKKDEIKS